MENKNDKQKSKSHTTPRKNSSTNNKNKKKTNKKKKKSKLSQFFKIFLIMFFSICLISFVIGMGYIFAVIKSTPELDISAVTTLSESSSFYDDSGEFMDNLNSEIQRNVIDYDEMPQYLKDAFVSIEDQRFYKHSGIDIRRIAGSLITDVKKILRGERSFHGGSTITQQLLKNTILSNEDSAVERKIKEIYLALQLEKKLTKDQILHQYLNTIPLGGMAYGVDAAANFYFNKPASDLNLIQCAYIAGVTQAPTYYSPYSEKNIADPSPYITRTKSVLSKMKELGKINEDEYNAAIASIDNGELTFERNTIDYTLDYEWYINPTLKQVKADLKEKYMYSDDEVNNLLVTGGLKIYTNMNRTLQDYTQSTLDNFDLSTIGLQETYIEGSSTPEFQASATLVDYHTGRVLAMVGGRGDHVANANNRAYSGLKPIGSNTKPLTVYGPAINEKILTAGSTIDDAPLPDAIANKYLTDGEGYQPKNDDWSYSGNVTLREALNRSKNVCSVLIEDKIGLDTGLFYGKQFGLKYNNASASSISTLALGQFNNDPNDLDGGNTYILSSAYGVFGNSGTYTEPKLYSKVIDSTGKTILENETPETKQIFTAETAYIMYDILKGSAQTTGYNAIWSDMPVSGKTGTTTNNTDLWFTGITPYLSASVWIGYDTPKKIGYASSNTAASLWAQIMSKAHEGKEVTDISAPSTLVTASICKDSGKLATNVCSNDPRGNRVYTEYFISGTEPTGYCENHVYANGRVLVKKDYPNSATEDYPYLYTSENLKQIEQENNNKNSNQDKNKDKDKDKDKDTEKDKDKTDDNSTNNSSDNSENNAENSDADEENKESDSLLDKIFNR